MTFCLEKIIDNAKNITLPLSPAKLLKDKKIIIYGAGAGGGQLYGMLYSDSILIECFLDRNAKDIDSYCGIPKYRPEYTGFSESEKKNITVIIAVWDSSEHESIISVLRENGYEHFIMFEGIYYYYIRADNGIVGNIDYSYYIQNKPDILEACKLFEEPLSREIYSRNIKAYIEHNFTEFYPKVEDLQYFPKGIELSKGYDRFIDCGAYTGDTIENLYKTKGKIDSIVAFEPQEESYEKLSSLVNNFRYADMVTLFPCGVWRENRQLCFSTTTFSGISAISNVGKSIIQCVQIDSALQGFSPTFIKMDIEGAELDALIGARRTIIENEPDLAICVYHGVNDIWDIPLFINSINPRYKFYLRTHGHFGIETVLYATVLS